MNYRITHLNISEASRGLIIEVTVSIPTRRQYTNETHNFVNTEFNEIEATKSTLLALYRFWIVLRRRIKEMQNIPGKFGLETTNFAKGIFIN